MGYRPGDWITMETNTTELLKCPKCDTVMIPTNEVDDPTLKSEYQQKVNAGTFYCPVCDWFGSKARFERMREGIE